ncbi:uncharacterized protein LOC111713118 [Eurytemora carolleeae]|uniref:uncharacterized protein LOC111713118 n=1 Tax=Eurytemora carolleeae TaxID=1294199 RepID=UPI000C75D2A7|nr:uncharacterized protein LOC111713118 [Eurytemora carolleeae]|eukprot:XP_023343686.1 uncharacterized protein LOC111713118 [Eurytemora affinis]
MEFVLSYATKIESIKILNIPKLVRTDLETWFSTKHLPFLKTLIIFKGPSMNMETTMSILSDLPAISEIGISDLNSIDVPKSPEMRKLLLEIKRRDWDITLADFVDGVDAEERDFAKVQSLHWFHLTQIQENQCWKSQPF